MALLSHELFVEVKKKSEDELSKFKSALVVTVFE